MASPLPTPEEGAPLNNESTPSKPGTTKGNSTDNPHRCHTGPSAPYAAFAYVLWALLGFIFNFHRLYLAIQQRSKARRNVHLALWGSLLFLHALFWLFREIMQPWYSPCTGTTNFSMSRQCLFTQQTTAYAACYVVHIVILVFELFLWIADGALLWRWSRDTRENLPFTWHRNVFLVVAAVMVVVVIAWSQMAWMLK